MAGFVLMTLPEDLQRARRASLVAPAGTGTTELIVRAIATSSGERELVLTHTHAGVTALRSRFVKLGVPSGSYRVDTIAGFALRISASYPRTSLLADATPRGGSWNETYSAAIRVLSLGFGKELIRASYSGIYVDEYQDCTLDQHGLIMMIAETLPCRLLGDPLQGIFDFAGPTVSWPRDIDPSFEELSPLSTPWRWRGANSELGEYLLSIRPKLLRNEMIDISASPVQAGEATQALQVLTCSRLAKKGGSVVGIRRFPRDAHALARSLGGQFNSMEEMDCNDLVKFSELVVSVSGAARALQAIEFASSCMTQVNTRLAGIRTRLDSGVIPSSPTGSALFLVTAAIQALTATVEINWAALLQLVSEIEVLSGVRVFRRELLAEFKRSVRAVQDGVAESLQDAVWIVRDDARHRGRRLDERMISRTLLIKGLEFDRGVVLQADEFNSRELYVSLTRACTELVVLTPNGDPLIRYRNSIASS
jgi:hypothetical protein